MWASIKAAGSTVEPLIGLVIGLAIAVVAGVGEMAGNVA